MNILMKKYVMIMKNNIMKIIWNNNENIIY